MRADVPYCSCNTARGCVQISAYLNIFLLIVLFLQRGIARKWHATKTKMGYTRRMGENQIRQLRTIIKNNPSLLWYTNSYDQFDMGAIADAIYNYGSWENVPEYHHLVGMNTAKDIFQQLGNKRRNNLLPKVRHFFKLYYGRHT